MLKLTRHDEFDDTPDSYPFPTEAARFLRRGNRFEEVPDAPLDRGASAAARHVENAMRQVEMRLRAFRDVMGFPDSDPDRPRAA